MSQAAGFRSVYTLWRMLLSKNLKFRVFIHPKIQFPVIALFPVILSNHLKAELVNVKFSGFLDVRNYNCYVMYGI